MLEWAAPGWFFLAPLALLPWAAWWRPHSLRFSALAVVKVGWSWRRVAAVLVPVIESLVLILLVVAMARPQQVLRETQRESEGIDIMLALDTSGSMKAEDMGSMGANLSRLDAAKAVVTNFVAGRPDDRLGLVVFGEEAFVQVPLTLDHQGMRSLIQGVFSGMAGENRTAVGTAIAIATKRLKDLNAPSKVVILVTDGRSNAGVVDPLQAAEAAAALGVRVYTVGVGGGRSGVLGLFGGGADVDEKTLTAVANLTGGRYFRAADAGTLAKVYGEIDQLEKSTARVKEFVHRDELYDRALIPAIFLAFAQVALGWVLLRRLP